MCIGQLVTEGSHTAQFSYTMNTGSSCLHRTATAGLPSGAEITQDISHVICFSLYASVNEGKKIFEIMRCDVNLPILGCILGHVTKLTSFSS